MSKIDYKNLEKWQEREDKQKNNTENTKKQAENKTFVTAHQMCTFPTEES